MIHSMTAYAYREIKSNWGNASWEIHSVNQRYLEIYFHLPEQFRILDPFLRKKICSRLARGKIECRLSSTLKDDKKILFNINEEFSKELIEAIKWIKKQIGEGEVSLIDLLQWPGVIIPKEKNFNEINKEILLSFDNALEDLILARESEGKVLQNLIENRLKWFIKEVFKVRSHIPEILIQNRKRLIDKLEFASAYFEKHKLEQEIALMSNRIDITEELDRLEIHVNETFNILKKKEPVGRHLDFMMQEFNRESNTLASKSINADITNSAIKLKVLIEQMREQIQNIE